MALDKVHDMRDFLNFEEPSDGVHARRVTVYPGAGNPPIPTSENPISDYTIRNVALTANTEVIVTITVGTKRFQLNTRGKSPMKVRKDTGGDYWSLSAGAMLDEKIDPTVTLTFIFESTINDVLEIVEYV